MKIRLSFAKIEAIRAANGFYSEDYGDVMADLAAPKVAPETHDCAKIADVNAAIAAYVAKCEASGFCGNVFAKDVSPRGERACPGFKKLPAVKNGVIVNAAIGWAAGKTRAAL